jgi:hypothetical protein
MSILLAMGLIAIGAVLGVLAIVTLAIITDDTRKF